MVRSLFDVIYLCEATFFLKAGLKHHVLSIHEGIKSLECNNCNARFALKKDLNKYTESVHEKKRPFKYKVCEIQGWTYVLGPQNLVY